MTAKSKPTLSQVLANWLTDMRPSVQKGVLIGSAIVTFLAGGAVRDVFTGGHDAATPAQVDSLGSALEGRLSATMEHVAFAAAREVRRSQDDSLRVVAQHLQDSVGIPLIEKVGSLDDQVRRIAQAQGLTNRKIDALPRPDNATLSELMHTMQARDKVERPEQLDQVLEALQALHDDVEQMKRKMKITKKEFP